MRFPWVLLASAVACSGPSTSVNPSPRPTVERTVCPICPPAQLCPAPIHPTCPKQPRPLARDWYCMDLLQPDKSAVTVCYISTLACQKKRKWVQQVKRFGKPSQCKPQRTAYCFYMVDKVSMTRQNRCTRVIEDCEYTRKLIAEDPAKVDHVSECQAVLNTDPFETVTGYELRLVDGEAPDR